MPAHRLETLTRRPDAGDATFLLTLYCSTRATEVTRFGWPDAVVDAFLDQQHRAHEQHLATAFPHAEHALAIVDGAPVGRIVLDVDAVRVHVVDVALVPEHQGHGLGTALLEDAMARARALGVPVQLMVRAENHRARDLYARLGFVVLSDDGVDLLLSHDHAPEVPLV